MSRPAASCLRPAVALLVLAAALLASGCSAEPPEPDPTEAAVSHDSFRAPSALASYRYTLEIRLSGGVLDMSEAPSGLEFGDEMLSVSVSGRRVNPDREYVRSVSSFGLLSTERETIVIGERLWSRPEGGAWRQRATLGAPEDLIGQDVLLSPNVIFGEDDPALLRRITDDLLTRAHTFETLRGREVRYWRLDGEWLQGYEAEFSAVFTDVFAGMLRPDDLLIELWGDLETGVGVKLRVTAGSAESNDLIQLEMELFDLNDPDLQVEEPVGAIGP